MPGCSPGPLAYSDASISQVYCCSSLETLARRLATELGATSVYGCFHATAPVRKHIGRNCFEACDEFEGKRKQTHLYAIVAFCQLGLYETNSIVLFRLALLA